MLSYNRKIVKFSSIKIVFYHCNELSSSRSLHSRADRLLTPSGCRDPFGVRYADWDPTRIKGIKGGGVFRIGAYVSMEANEDEFAVVDFESNDNLGSLTSKR